MKGMINGVLVLVIIVWLTSLGVAQGEVSETFDLNSLVMKSTLKQDSSVTKVLTINKGNGQQINLEVVGLTGISLSEGSFILNDVKNVNVKFDSYGLADGVYIGSIKVSDSKNFYYLPVILEVESDEVLYDVNLDIPPVYSSIAPGGKLIAQVKVFDLTSGGTGAGLGVNSVDIEYTIKSVTGEVISSELDNIVVDKQNQVTKAITFSKNIPSGEYVFSVVVKYKGSVGVSSYLFSIGKKSGESILTGLFNGFSTSVVVITLLVLGFFFSLIWLFVYAVKDRDKMILEMKEHMENDYKRSLDLINRQERALRAKGIPEKEIVKEKIKKIKKLEIKHVQAKKHVEKLKHTNNNGGMEKKLLEWKKRGYNTQGMEYKLSGLSVGEMKKIINEWKEEYK
ncbi:MAG: hypothetical protein AABX11_03880 [Nanoarchaeota archaeon]